MASRVEALIEEWEIPGGAENFIDDTVVRGVESRWAFTTRENGHTVMERSGASNVTTSSMSMDVRTISETFSWRQDTIYDSAVILLATRHSIRIRYNTH